VFLFEHVYILKMEITLTGDLEAFDQVGPGAGGETAAKKKTHTDGAGNGAVVVDTYRSGSWARPAMQV
jgi:hypothetical protein